MHREYHPRDVEALAAEMKRSSEKTSKRTLQSTDYSRNITKRERSIKEHMSGQRRDGSILPSSSTYTAAALWAGLSATG